MNVPTARLFTENREIVSGAEETSTRVDQRLEYRHAASPRALRHGGRAGPSVGEDPT